MILRLGGGWCGWGFRGRPRGLETFGIDDEEGKRAEMMTGLPAYGFTDVGFEEGIDLRDCGVKEGSRDWLGRWLVQMRLNFREKLGERRGRGGDSQPGEIRVELGSQGVKVPEG